MRQPKVFLFDEPLSNLDAELRVQMRLELARLHKQIGATMIYVTHDQVEAMTLADKIFVLKGGVVQQSGRPLDLYDDPDNRFVAGFIGSPTMNFLTGRVVGQTEDGVAVQPDGADGAPIEAQAARRSRRPAPRSSLGMRPEHLEIADRPDARPADHGRDGGGPRRRLLPARAHRGRPAAGARASRRPENYEGRRIAALDRADRVLVFDEAGERLR